jgi:hypothetical protein
MISYSKAFTKQIFGNQYELGLDYLTLLCFYPEQQLPALVIVEDKGSHCSNFFRWLESLTNFKFKEVRVQDLANQVTYESHNMFYFINLNFCDIADIKKIELMIEDQRPLIDPVSRNRIYFQLGLIAGNNIDVFKYLNTFFWIRKIDDRMINSIVVSECLHSEIHDFRRFLQNRTLVSKKENRLWFADELIQSKKMPNIHTEDLVSICTEMLEYNQECLKRVLALSSVPAADRVTKIPINKKSNN